MNWESYKSKTNIVGPYNLFLDDFRDPQMAYNIISDSRFLKQQWIVVRDYVQFCKCIDENGMPALVAFDHDLVDDHYANCQKRDAWFEYHSWSDRIPTGYDCAVWLAEKCKADRVARPESIVHTQNTFGGVAIRHVMKTGEEYHG